MVEFENREEEAEKKRRFIFEAAIAVFKRKGTPIFAILPPKPALDGIPTYDDRGFYNNDPEEDFPQSDFPTIEEVEEALRDLDSSDLLDDIVDEWGEEMQDLIDELEEEIENLEETEDELPDAIEETEEVSYEEDIPDEEDSEEDTKEKCWIISLGVGDKKITFSTCDKKIEKKDPNKPPDIDLEEKDTIDPPIPPTEPGRLICPINKIIFRVTKTGRYKEEIEPIAEYIVGWFTPTFETKYLLEPHGIDYSIISGATESFTAWNVAWDYSESEFGPKTSGGATLYASSFGESSNTTNSLFEEFKLLSGYSFPDSATDYLKFIRKDETTRTLIRYSSARSDACYILPLGEEPPPSLSPPSVEEVDDLIVEEKDGDKMSDECCKATLSLLRQIYHVTGGAEDSLYPSEVTIDESDDVIEVNNIKEKIDLLSLPGQKSNVDNTLLQGIANVTGTSATPLYPYPSGEEGEQVNNLLEEIREKLAVLIEIAKVTGALEGYGKLPETMIGNDPKQIDISNTPEMLLYIFKYLDSVLGQYPIETKIEDADISKEGEQPEVIKLPNISEALAELYGVAYTNAINIKDKRLEVATNAEIYFIKKNLFQTKYMINSIIEWLGFEPDLTRKKLKFATNPKKRKYDEFLEPSERNVEVLEFKEDKKNKDFRYYLDKLLRSATTIQKAFGIPVNPGDISGSILSFIKGLGNDPAEEWNQFKEELEDGKFTDDDLGSGDNPRISSPTSKDESNS
ncbi:hypothetical protein [Okeania sp. SIO2B3]|uniref:hypothetical protein n=1 Tax=Okeania sp. SIO2B3 TaxID=2607784 RepID=UPI0013BEBA6B|nr:hypothetical protein [Okeania sp. SIO2B3]NET40620.1 hypothetical protein [Okeania sp. SIO2B3]